MSTPFRSGFVAVLGRPNVGKSTLVNRLVGRKVSIVSDHPQTTRRRISGVVTGEDYQLVLLDLPGFQRPFDSLTRRMQAAVIQLDFHMADVLEIIDYICQRRLDEFRIDGLADVSVVGSGRLVGVRPPFSQYAVAPSDSRIAFRRLFAQRFEPCAHEPDERIAGRRASRWLALHSRSQPRGGRFFGRGVRYLRPQDRRNPPEHGTHSRAHGRTPVVRLAHQMVFVRQIEIP